MTLSRFRLSERQVLHFIMVVCFVGFISAVVIVFLRKSIPRTETDKRPIVRWISPRSIEEGHEIRFLIASLDDPSLMSLPDIHAFSKALWQRHTSPDNSPISPDDTIAYLDTTPPRELPPLLRSTPLPETVRNIAEKPLAVVIDMAPTDTLTALNHSTIQLTGDLEQYQILRSPSLPAIASETPLRPTLVRLAVTAGGTVRYAMLYRSCGNETADAQALETARQLCFVLPSDTAPQTLLWGVAKFLWVVKTP